jgi:hypothetical protein
LGIRPHYPHMSEVQGLLVCLALFGLTIALSSFRTVTKLTLR